MACSRNSFVNFCRGNFSIPHLQLSIYSVEGVHFVEPSSRIVPYRLSSEADHQPLLFLQYNFLNVIQPWHIAPDGIVIETEPF